MTQPHLTRRRRNTALGEDLRFRMLRAIDGAPDLSQRGLAGETGMSLGAVNGLLNGLIETGFVQIGGGEAAHDSFRIVYVLTDAGRDELKRLSGRYLARRQAERAALDAEIAALVAEFGQDAPS